MDPYLCVCLLHYFLFGKVILLQSYVDVDMCGILYINDMVLTMMGVTGRSNSMTSDCGSEIMYD